MMFNVMTCKVPKIYQDEAFHDQNTDWGGYNAGHFALHFGMHNHNQVRFAMGLRSDQIILYSWFENERTFLGINAYQFRLKVINHHIFLNQFSGIL